MAGLCYTILMFILMIVPDDGSLPGLVRFWLFDSIAQEGWLSGDNFFLIRTVSWCLALLTHEQIANLIWVHVNTSRDWLVTDSACFSACPISLEITSAPALA
jgi:hypothetical protein